MLDGAMRLSLGDGTESPDPDGTPATLPANGRGPANGPSPVVGARDDDGALLDAPPSVRVGQLPPDEGQPGTTGNAPGSYEKLHQVFAPRRVR